MALLISFLVPAPAAAQPTGYQEYYVLGYEEHVWRAFRAIYDGEASRVPGQICSTVSLVATADYQVVYYDHWEDGYEADLLNPVQSTTKIYGDGNPGNGGTGTDVLIAGDDINLTSTLDVTGPTAINGYVPVDPARNPDYLRYDGGDRIITSGGPVDLAHAMWPLDESWVGGAWEVYSRQAYADAHSYRLPIGEDLYNFDADIYGDFRNVYLELGAFEDNTTVSIDNGTDVVNVTLDRGQVYSSMGYINSTPVPSLTINVGTTIRANNPVQVGLVTGADSTAGFQGRFLIALPDVLSGADYIVPIPSGYSSYDHRNVPTEIYLSNPNDFEITVKAYDRFAQSTFVISPTSTISSTVPYSQKRGSYIPRDTAARFTSSDGVFRVVVCADTSDRAYDWGFSGIPSKYLTRDYYISWAPGSTNIPPTENGSPVWVTPLADDTTFYVDFSPLDGVIDDTFTLDVLQQRRIFDPDNDNTGMHVWATSEFAVAWGEDPSTADVTDPYLDMGFATLPLLQRWLDPILTLDKQADPTILPPDGGVVTFTLTTQAHNAPLVNVDITDTLPLNWTYVPNSTRVTYPTGSIGSPEPAIRDEGLYWDLSADLGANQSLSIKFQAQITDTAGIFTSVNRAEAVGKDKYSGALFNPNDETTIYISALNLVKSVSKSQARIGDTLVYTLHYANLSDSMTATNVTLRDVVPIQYVTFQSASDGGSYSGATSTITWNLGTLTPGESGSLTFIVKVNDFVEDGTVIGNRGHIRSNETEEAGSNVAQTIVQAPNIAFAKDGPTVAAREQVITYTLSYENSGGVAATGVTIQDTVPVSTTYVSGSMEINRGSGWVALTDNPGDGDEGAYVAPMLIITPGTIAADESGQIRFKVEIEDILPPGSLILNSATIDRDLDIPRESNLAVTRISDLLISKAAAQSEVLPGDELSYTLIYENASETTPQTGVTVLEPVPDHTSLIPGSVYGGDQIAYSWDNGDTWHTTLPITPVTHIRWYDAALPTESSATVGFGVQVATALPPDTTIQNIAHITSTETAAYFNQWIPSNQVEVAVNAASFATIYGTVFEDRDGDGVQDAGESGIPDVLITLDETVTTTTDLDGSYTFSTTVAGVHTVVETDPAVYIPTASEATPIPMDLSDPRYYFSTAPNEVHVGVALGNSYQVDFGDALNDSNFASIHGTVFNDVDGDGVQDKDELGIPDALVTLDETTTTTTDIHGRYVLSTTVAGVHAVVENDPGGYFSTTPNEVHIDAMLGNGYTVNFGDALTTSGMASIYGTVFSDANENGVHDIDEAAIPGVTVTLDQVTAVTTNARGGYTLSTTVPGPHTVVETDPDGYASTTSNNVQIDIDLGNGYKVNFGDTSSVTNTCDGDIYEEDDTIPQAVIFAIGTSQAHQFCDDDTDWVKFPVRVNTTYTITTYAWGQRADTVLTLFDPSGQTLLTANDDHQGTTDYSSRITWKAPSNGTYYVRTTNQGRLTGYHTEYDLVIEAEDLLIIYLPIMAREHSAAGSSKNSRPTVLCPTGVITHTCPDAYEIDDTWEQAHAIEAGEVQIHSFDSDATQYAADKDFVRFDVPAGKIIIFTIALMTNTRTLMELYDRRGDAVGARGTGRLTWISTTHDRYYLGVSPEDGMASFGCADAAGYTLSMETRDGRLMYLPVTARSS